MIGEERLSNVVNTLLSNKVTKTSISEAIVSAYKFGFRDAEETFKKTLTTWLDDEEYSVDEEDVDKFIEGVNDASSNNPVE